MRLYFFSLPLGSAGAPITVLKSYIMSKEGTRLLIWWAKQIANMEGTKHANVIFLHSLLSLIARSDYEWQTHNGGDESRLKSTVTWEHSLFRQFWVQTGSGWWITHGHLSCGAHEESQKDCPTPWTWVLVLHLCGVGIEFPHSWQTRGHTPCFKNKHF